MAAPIGHTCPDIDRAIRYVGQIQSYLDHGENWGEDDVKHVDSQLNGIIDEFESIRNSNDTLRGWGKELEDELHTAAGTISEQEDKISELEDELKEERKESARLSMQIEDLEKQIDQYEARCQV